MLICISLDMFGRGHDDFLFVYGDGTGRIDLFENTLKPPSWKTHGTILETKRDRKSLRFGDCKSYPKLLITLANPYCLQGTVMAVAMSYL